MIENLSNTYPIHIHFRSNWYLPIYCCTKISFIIYFLFLLKIQTLLSLYFIDTLPNTFQIHIHFGWNSYPLHIHKFLCAFPVFTPYPDPIYFMDTKLNTFHIHIHFRFNSHHKNNWTSQRSLLRMFLLMFLIKRSSICACHKVVQWTTKSSTRCSVTKGTKDTPDLPDSWT